MLDAHAAARSVLYKDINCNFNTHYYYDIYIELSSNERGLNV